MPASVRGYAVRPSCFAGDRISIALATGSPLTPDVAYTIRIVDAVTDTAVSTPTPLAAANLPFIQAVARHADERGYGWRSISLSTDAAWPSGFYYAEILEGPTPITMSRAFFVIRTPRAARTNPIVVLWPSATAYAYWGSSDLWGHRVNLYDSIHQFRGRRTTTQRPLILPDGTETVDGLGTHFGGHDSPSLTMFSWLNATLRLTFRADACSSWDVHNDPSALDGYRVLVLAGHDEYWSHEMRNTVEAFVRQGGHLAVFSGNSVWWQIRYEQDGSQIVCYKSLFEDPLLGPDSPRVTTNWSTDPPGRPENSLTGVGFRYGWMNSDFGVDLTILPPLPGEAPHPAFAGVVDGTGTPLASFGADLGGEADGIELDFSDPLRPQPTFRDGTPSTFRVLAYNENVGGSLRGRGVIGYFTNGGTVFTAPFTAWAARVGAGAAPTKLGPIASNPFQRITTNVISWLLQRGREATMGPSRVVAPPAGWATVGVGPFTALAGSAEGHVFLALGNQIISRHPDMAPPSNPVSLTLPSSAAIEAMGSDLYGRHLLAAVGSQLFVVDITGETVNSVLSFASVDSGEHFAGATAVNHEDTVYAIVGSVGDQAELRVSDRGAGWWRVGDASGLRGLTSCDGYLVAATNDHRLVIRLAGKIDESTMLVADETWVEIGSAPDIFALGQYYGRLYGLSGALPNVALMCRSSRPDAERMPVDFGRLLFYDRAKGSCAVGRFLGNGDYENANGFSVGPDWTHVTRVNNRMVLFYRSSDGTAVLGRVETDGSWTEIRRLAGFGNWTTLVSDGDHILFYQHGSSDAYVGRFDVKTGEYVNTDYRSDFSTTWTLAAATWGIAPLRLTGRGRYVVFYAPDGTIAICEIDQGGTFHTRGFGSMMNAADTLIPAGQLGVFAYDSHTGRGEFGEMTMARPSSYTRIKQWPDFERQWSLGAGRNGLALFYHADTGVAVAGGFSRSGLFQELNRWDLGQFVSGWSNIIGIHSLPAINPLLLPVGPISGVLNVRLPPLTFPRVGCED